MTKPAARLAYDRTKNYTGCGAAEQKVVGSMMAAVYATLLVAFVLDLSGLRRLALSCLFVSLALGLWLFLWEIYSPDYGFRMPWLKAEVAPIMAPFRNC
jgi:hypothetical protein